MSQRFQRPYPLEVRREAIRLAGARGRRYQDVAVEHGISGESLRKWIRQDELDTGERSDGLTSGERSRPSPSSPLTFAGASAIGTATSTASASGIRARSREARLGSRIEGERRRTSAASRL